VRKKLPRKARKSSPSRKSRTPQRHKLKQTKKSTKKSHTSARAQRRPQVRKKVSVAQARHRKKLSLAKRAEALAGDQRRFVRETFKNKASAKTRCAQSQELAGMLERARFAGKELGLSKTDIRGYRYDDGRSIVRMRVPLPAGVGARAKILELSEHLVLPPGTFVEGNFLLDPSDMMRKGYPTNKKEYLKFQGLLRIQFWGSKNPPNAFLAMFDTLEKLHAKGFKQPEQIYVRLGRTSEEILRRFHQVPKSERKRKRLIDPEQPFTRFAPPAEGTLVRKQRPKLPLAKKPRKAKR
jgi:hypothetical protein